MLTPQYPPLQRRRLDAQYNQSGHHQSGPPGDMREGFNRAYDVVREGVLETAETLQEAVTEERAQGRWPLRG
jgi:hypothetical protein